LEEELDVRAEAFCRPQAHGVQNKQQVMNATASGVCWLMPDQLCFRGVIGGIICMRLVGQKLLKNAVVSNTDVGLLMQKLTHRSAHSHRHTKRPDDRHPAAQRLGLVWIFRWPGLSTKPIRGATRFIIAVRQMEITKLVEIRKPNPKQTEETAVMG